MCYFRISLEEAHGLVSLAGYTPREGVQIPEAAPGGTDSNPRLSTTSLGDDGSRESKRNVICKRMNMYNLAVRLKI